MTEKDRTPQLTKLLELTWDMPDDMYEAFLATLRRMKAGECDGSVEDIERIFKEEMDRR